MQANRQELQEYSKESYIQDVVLSSKDVREKMFLNNFSTEMMCLVELNGYFKQVNDVFFKVLGFTREEILARSFLDLVHPDDREMTQACFLSLVKGNANIRFENRYQSKNGDYKWLEWNAVELEDEDLHYFVARDITERKMMEKLFFENGRRIRLFVKHTPVAVAMFDKEMNYIMASQRWLEDYQLTEIDIKGRSHYEILPHISLRWKQIHKEVLEGCVKRSDEELLKLPLGKDMWIKWEMHPWRTSEGMVGGIIISREDITERKIIERQLEEYRIDLEERVIDRTSQLKQSNEQLSQEIQKHKQTEGKLEQSYEQLQNLSAHLEEVREQERTGIAREIHDELGQALTALKMDCSWFQKRLDKKDLVLEDKVKSMKELIDSTVKTVQRISSELRPGILDDLGLVAAMEWQMDEFRKRTSLDCYLDIQFDDAQMNTKYATTLFRILQETLTNIVRHAQASKVSVSLNESASKIVMIVDDNGRGVTKKQLESPEAFGLMGMRERIHYLNGDIDIQGKKKRGTIVRVALPKIS